MHPDFEPQLKDKPRNRPRAEYDAYDATQEPQARRETFHSMLKREIEIRRENLAALEALEKIGNIIDPDTPLERFMANMLIGFMNRCR